MRARNWAGVALGGVALAGALALPMTANADVAAQGTVPSCVRFTLQDGGFTDRITLRNKCKRAKRVKVILAHKRDSDCLYLAAGETRYHTWSYPGRFDGLRTC